MTLGTFRYWCIDISLKHSPSIFTSILKGVVLKCKGKTHVEWSDTNSKGDDKEIDVDEMQFEDAQYLIGSGI